jgi:ABC-type transporter Mla MlaB component
VALAGDIGLQQLAALKKRLSTVLARAQPVILDATRLTRIDTGGLQLLAAFVRDRQSSGRAVVWQGTPPWFAAATARLGLAVALAVA